MSRAKVGSWPWRRDQRRPWPRPNLGLAIGTGTDVAIEASDLTLVSGDLRAAADAIRPLTPNAPHHQAKPLLGLRLQRGRLSVAMLGYLNRALRRRRHGPV